MKSKTDYRSINNLHSVVKFFYYASIILAVMSIITIFATLIFPNIPIEFEKGLRGWLYTVDLPTGIGSSSFMIQRSISRALLPFMPIEMIHVKSAVLIDMFFSVFSVFVLINIGLKKLTNLTGDILKGESPFQLKHTKPLRVFSLIIVLYSTMKNTVLCILFSIFVTNEMVITIEFMWSGIIIGILGYIFSDIAEYGLFLQDEYDTTL